MWKKWLILAAAFGAVLYFASNYGGRIPYMLLYTAAAIPVVSGIYVIWVTSRFKFSQNVNQRTIVKGEPVDYYFSINNEDWFFYDSIEVEFFQDTSRLAGVEGSLEYHLLPGEKKEIREKLCCNYRGEYEVGACSFRISDYLHLIALNYKVETLLKIMVLPRIVQWKYEQEILEEDQGKNQGKNCPNGELDVQVRNYQQGDSIRQIHWKASAKAQKLMSRECHEIQKEEMVIFLDLQKQQGTAKEILKYEDEIIEQAVAAVNACRKRRIPCTVILDYQGKQSIRIETEGQWKTFYDVCGKLRFSADTPVENLPLENALKQRMRYAVFFTGKLETPLLLRIRTEFSQAQTSIIAVSVKGKENCASQAGRFKNAGICVYQELAE